MYLIVHIGDVDVPAPAMAVQPSDMALKTSYTKRYDMIRYDTVYLRALESWRYSQHNLAHGTETKNNEKLKTTRTHQEMR